MEPRRPVGGELGRLELCVGALSITNRSATGLGLGLELDFSVSSVDM
jgi:hypothetical protein